MEKLLKDEVYYFLADLDADAFEFIPHLFRVLEVHDIEDNLIADVFLDNFLRYTYHYTVFFNLLRL